MLVEIRLDPESAEDDTRWSFETLVRLRRCRPSVRLRGIFFDVIKRWQLLLLLGLAACSGGSGADRGKPFFQGKAYPAYRYRVTVVVDTPQGERRGSMVGETKRFILSDWAIDSPRALRSRICTEAIPVALPNGKILFALAVGDPPLFLGMPRLPLSEFIAKHEANPTVGIDYRVNQVLNFRGRIFFEAEERDLPNGAVVFGYPEFVTFDDLAVPKSVRMVDPLNLEKSFGKGYKLVSVFIERTNDPVTHRIEKVLPWLVGMEKNLDGESATFKDSLANQLDSSAFIGDACHKK